MSAKSPLGDGGINMMELQAKLCAPVERKTLRFDVSEKNLTLIDQERLISMARQKQAFNPSPQQIPSFRDSRPVFVAHNSPGSSKDSPTDATTESSKVDNGGENVNLFVRTVPASAMMFRARL
mmetsp:Transcript_52607/g.107265  ORF Transcript_52607/g.107265 Transcript_52607/m.107265 type:complete len:123 (-) Transcript_52607:157-525(-)|eukprot:CAMPEP_0181335758 /NCGR_PEP_ID=MMETSP1101-20121128/27017_1 /TAXON_ID=46948 /ORGANISM="Rhodomonas abbreviata, Strain Caron Lab Isolate" /LENGTH=122 /DNA_ID=CAMNT_0023445929 /DNA_START=105 /DNA_END=473 /DNA_ORIENTATION=-